MPATVNIGARWKLYREGQSLKGPPFFPSKRAPIFPKKYWPFERSFFTRNAWTFEQWRHNLKNPKIDHCNYIGGYAPREIKKCNKNK